MGLEAATYISDLVATNPVGATDTVAQGDDHLRLLKTVIQATWPAITGAVLSTHTELNAIHGSQWRAPDGSSMAPSYSFANDLDTGIWRNTANSIIFTTGGISIAGFSDSGCGVSFADGAASAPQITFRNDPDTGFYRPTSNTVGFAAAGVSVGGFTSTNFQLIDGSLAAPVYTFANDLDTGLYRTGSNGMAVSVGGVFGLGITNITGSGQTVVNTGSVGVPGLGFIGDSNTGVYSPGADSVALVAGGAAIATFDNASVITLTKQLALTINSANLAMAGAANALPSNPVGYMAITLNGTQRRIPYYAD